jgi:hypothetical protein
MASLRTWRTAAATLLLVALATTSNTAAASARTPGHQQAHYCKQVDAYRIRICAEALLPAGPLGRQLRWELAQLTGEAATLPRPRSAPTSRPSSSPSGERGGPRRCWLRPSARPSPSLGL